MREIVAVTFLSLDGVMQAPGGPDEDLTGGFGFGGWSVPYWDDAMNEAIVKTFAEPFDLLLGRRTYEIFAAHWPHAESGPISDAFNGVTKYVASRSPLQLDWQNSVHLRGDVAAEVRALKRQDGPRLLLQGSGDLIQTLLRHDLIDELGLWTFPLILGSGKRLLGEGALPVAMQLTGSKASSTGVVMSSYRRAGEIKPGSFAPEQPSEAEIARRRKWAAEG